MTATQQDDKLSRLYRDCQDLARYIATARREIAQIRPTDLQQQKLPRAGQELAAIVGSTEQATNTIMAAAEGIMAQAGDNDAITAACMEIFEACSFQDITGQRVAKVVATIDAIEQRLTRLRAAWGPDLGFDEPAEEPPHEDDERSLLNGPALAGEGIDQDAVDALFD